MNKLKNIIRKLIKNNVYILYLWTEFLHIRGKLSLIFQSDIQNINKIYKSYCGRYPNIENPQLFSEKMQWLKLYYRDPRMVICADKFKVSEYLNEKGYSYLLNDIITSFNDIKDFDLDSLPDKFVLKANHGSGWNLVVTDKKRVNWFIYKRIMKLWLSGNIFWNGREWHYKDIKPKIVVEKYLEDKSGLLMDYKFFCFNGEPKFLQTNKNRGTKDHAQNFYSMDWEIMPFGKSLKPRPDIEIEKPVSFDKMVELAKDLSKSFPFMRVDFYEVNDSPLFGEMTFFPASGMPDIRPEEYDKVLGDMLILPKRNN